ncbi:MAG TPA: LacI family DNA-binding transcriptional regulator [Solirubrobacterales bacterium]
MSGKIGIKDVAAAAGVSITTVSHALNGKGRLPTETRERVREIADRLGYRPNVNARNLAGGRTGLVALTVSQEPELAFQLGDFDYFASLIRYATTAALARGFALAALPPVADNEDVFHHLPLDGAIVVDPVPGDRSLDYLRSQRTPIVTTGRPVDVAAEEEEGYWIDNEHIEGMRSVLDHLAEVGAERIALVLPSYPASYVADMRRGYVEWCAARACEERIVMARDLTEPAGFEAARSLLDGPEPPDAIYASLDRLAIGALMAAETRGIEVPGALRVACCTDSYAARHAATPLTTLALNPEQIGEEAANMLIDLVEGVEPRPRHRFIPTKLLPRESTLGGTAVATGAA